MKKSRREFFRDAATLLVLPARAIVPATLDDILELNHARAQQSEPANEVQEELSFNIGLRNYDTGHWLVGRITERSVGRATLNVVHDASRYHIQINSGIAIHGSWSRMELNLRGRYSYANGTPRFQPQFYWLRYREGGAGTTPKTFIADIHFDFPTRTARSYGYHEQEGQETQRYGSEENRLESRFPSSTRDLVSAMMQARFLPAQRRRRLNTIIEGVPRALTLRYQGRGLFQPTQRRGYPTRMYSIHFPTGILPETSWDLHMQFHDAADRTPLSARLVKSGNSEIIFELLDPSSSIPSTNLYPAP